MTRTICDICRKRIKAAEASLTVNTPASSEAVHVVCLREREANQAGKDRAAA